MRLLTIASICLFAVNAYALDVVDSKEWPKPVPDQMRKCTSNSDCIVEEDGYCHNAVVLAKAYHEAWLLKDAKDTEWLNSHRIVDWCGKPGQDLPSAREVTAYCQQGFCFMDDRRGYVNGYP